MNFMKFNLTVSGDNISLEHFKSQRHPLQARYEFPNLVYDQYLK